ncbi:MULTISPECIES: BON domain-containing protein [unclassified Roseateles]|uniref:BON domain-containing protein n=1 Tax=unclassified Roseateles TaxID=2626991 RepID=UPI0006F8D73F|nr:MULTISPECIES: BON domain-containing protein [unclassified Roseateles]KQW51645.1 hypothetical protein ASC81_03185 [Pelomonas sp. Root405]KRA77878.1 hypothetical protein ASD88_03185 [Pelomonas sp. Root662]
MKFPKSLHAEGWADHIDKTKSDKSVAASPLHAAKAAPGGMRMNNPPRVAPSLSATPPVASPRVEPMAAARPQPRTVAVPPQRENRLSWMIGAGAGVAILAAVAIWAMNRPADTSAVPPAIVTGSTTPQAEVAAATPLVDAAPAATEADASAAAPATTVAAAPTPAEPATPVVGLPVTTSRPAPESRTVAQAPVPAARPDMVVRAAPGSAASLPPTTTPYLQPPTPIAAAPATDAQPLGVSPGTEPIVMPPTAAGPVALTTPQAAVPPQPSTTPATVIPPVAAPSTSPGTPPLAQAQPQPQPQPQPQVQPAPEDTGITVQVRMALAADSTLSAVPIAVSTDRGVVKLEGQAPDAPTRERATVVASSATGVKAVDNRLTVAPTTQVSQAPVTLQ